MEDAIYGGRSKGNNASIEEYLNLTQWKPYRKQMTLVSLASKFRTELGPAQPQLVYLKFAILNFCLVIFPSHF